jgi:hypothetical protein
MGPMNSSVQGLPVGEGLFVYVDIREFCVMISIRNGEE